jgi:hypothetical protein
MISASKECDMKKVATLALAALLHMMSAAPDASDHATQGEHHDSESHR